MRALCWRHEAGDARCRLSAVATRRIGLALGAPGEDARCRRILHVLACEGGCSSRCGCAGCATYPVRNEPTIKGIVSS